MRRLAPSDEEDAKTKFAEDLQVPREEIKDIRVADWISGECVVFLTDHSIKTAWLEPAN